MSPRRHRLKPTGGILGVALLMTMLGGLFIAGWVALASMRAVYARNGEQAAKRRLMLENSKGYSRQMAVQNAMSGDSTIPAITSNLGSSGNYWGGISTAANAWTNLKLYSPPTAVSYPATGYYTTVHPYNGLGLRPGASFLSKQRIARPANYQNILDPFTGHLFLKGICPCLAGDGLVIYRKPETESAEIETTSSGSSSPFKFLVEGRLVVRHPASFFNRSNTNLGSSVRLDTRCRSLYIQSFDTLNRVTGTDTTGAELMPSNTPAVPSTYGPFPRPSGNPPTTAELYRGELNVIQNNSNTTNSLWHIQQRESDADSVANPIQTISDGSAPFGVTTDPVYLKHETSPAYPPPAWPSGYEPIWKVLYVNLSHASLPNLRVYGVVHQIVFLGQTTSAAYNAAAALTPRSVLIIPDAASRTVQDIRFVRENNRGLIVGAKGNAKQPLGLYWTGPVVSGVTDSFACDWKLVFINEYRQITCNLPTAVGGDQVSIVGGILTNWTMKRLDSKSVANFKITPDWTSGYSLARLLPRDTWLESYFLLTAP